ncbi:hypothetical protein [Rhodopirellula bahusiensis]|uniref:hypothetical protein n=1 Tax=Rhodopirellula bahusiensis TaxID=2014065 RepID=UPI003265E8D9
MSHNSTIHSVSVGENAACDAFEARMNQWIDTGSEHSIDDDRHLANCVHCQQTLAIWRQLETGMPTAVGAVGTSGTERRFLRVAGQLSVAMAACLIAVIVLRAPSNEMSVGEANSLVGPSGDGVQWNVASSSEQSDSQGESTVRPVPVATDSTRESLLADSGKLSAGWPAGSVIDGAVADQPSGQNMLLAQFIAQSRPTVTQLSVGVAPLGRTLQRTANLFY